MRVTVIFASHRKNGNTGKVLDKFMSGYEGECEFIDITKNAPVPCCSCGKCRDKSEKCKYNDLDIIFEKIKQSDRLIFAVPVYNYSVPSEMKAFFDRLQPYYEAGLKDAPLGRKGFLLSSCGCSGKFSVDVVRKQSQMAFCELGFSFFGDYFQTDTDKREMSAEEKLNVEEMGRLFLEQ